MEKINDYKYQEVGSKFTSAENCAEPQNINIQNIMKKRILLIQSGTVPQPICEEVGDFPQWFSRAMNISLAQMNIIRAYENEKLPSPDKNTTTIITGSWSMVTEHLEWSENVAGWIRQAFENEVPLFGVCYGHQLMSYALGGGVDFNPKGMELGAHSITLNEKSKNDTLLKLCPSNFTAQLSHMQTVVALPPNAVSLASSYFDDNQIIRYSKFAISTQFHPEFTKEILISIIKNKNENVSGKEMKLKTLSHKVTDAIYPREILRKFIDTYNKTTEFEN